MELINVNKIIAIANQKGGVGKTTTCINLCASLAATKRRVLLIDLDPQGNATMGSGIDKMQLNGSINDVLLGKVMLGEILKSSDANYDVLPANADLTVAEIRLLKAEQSREFVLKKLLDTLRDCYNFILIDCPPSLNMLTINALVASDSVLIPMQCEYFALEGLTALLSTLENIRNKANPDLKIEGLLRTMYDGRNRLTVEVSEQLLAHFGDKVYQTIIPRNVRLAEAPSHGMPVLLYDKTSQGAAAYLALAGEVVRRHEQNEAIKKDVTHI